MEILKRRQAAADDSDYVFPAQWRYNKNPHIVLAATVLRTNTGIHGLRRSFATVGEKLKIRRQDIDLLINHFDKSVTGEHYACTDVDDLRQPVQAICNEIERLMIHGVGACPLRSSLSVFPLTHTPCWCYKKTSSGCSAAW